MDSYEEERLQEVLRIVVEMIHHDAQERAKRRGNIVAVMTARVEPEENDNKTER